MTTSEKISVMVVEDNPDMLDIYTGMFKDEPLYDVEMYTDAMEALRHLEDKHFDIIILDIIMEPLTGESFFVYLRGNIKTMNIPVVIVSVLDPTTLDALKRLDHSRILQKPIRKEDLFNTMKEMLTLYGKKS